MPTPIIELVNLQLCALDFLFNRYFKFLPLFCTLQHCLIMQALVIDELVSIQLFSVSAQKKLKPTITLCICDYIIMGQPVISYVLHYANNLNVNVLKFLESLLLEA